MGDRTGNWFSWAGISFAGAALLAIGTSGPAGAEIRAAQLASSSGGTDSTALKNWEVECPGGLRAIGGGVSVNGITTGTAAVASVPLIEIGSGDPIGWFAEVTEMFLGASWGVTARAVCGHVDGLERVAATSPSTSDITRTVEASCPPGKEALSGGFDLLGSSAGVAIAASRPVIDPVSGAPTGWSVSAWEANATSASWSVRAEVLCADETILPFVTQVYFDSEPFALADLTCPRGWIATGGGRAFSGSYTEWITASAPPGNLERWSVRTQRPAGATASIDNSYYILCPEPGALASVAAAAATLALRRRRRG